MILIIFLLKFIKSNFLGFDLGTSNIKGSVLRSGRNIEIILNEQTKRKTPSIVSFEPSIPIILENIKKIDRRIGNSALNVLYRNSSLVLRSLTDVIGKNWSIELQNSLNERFIDYKMNNCYINGIDPFIPLSMILEKFIYHAEIQIQQENIKDAVIAIPSYFTDSQKGKIAAAAKLAGLNLIKTIDEKTALGLVYALEKTSFFLKESKTVAILDFGSSVFTITGYNFSAKIISQKGRNPKTIPKIEEILYYWDDSLGGIDFDILLAKYLFKKYNLPKIDYSLIQEAEKIKLSLTLTDTINISLDNLNEKIIFTRKEFIEICEPILIKIKNLLKKINIKFDSIEVIGGSSRIPIVQDIIIEYLGNISRSLNSDESIVMGAGYTAAMTSGTFKLNEVIHESTSPHSIDLIIGNKSLNIIKIGQVISKFKNARFDPINETRFKIEYTSKLPIGSTNLIGEWEFDLDSNINSNEIRIQISFGFNKHLRFIINNCILFYKNEKGEVKQQPLNIRRILNPFKTSKEENLENKKLINNFKIYEQKLLKISEIRNLLESLLFEINENIEKDPIWILVSSNEDKIIIKDLINKYRNWIDNLINEKEEEEYKEKLKNLTELIKPIQYRVQEYRTRNLIIKEIENLMNEIENSIFKIWPMRGLKIPKNPKKITLDLINNTKQWLNNKKIEQEKLNSWENPILITSDIEIKKKKLNDMFIKLDESIQEIYKQNLKNKNY